MRDEPPAEAVTDPGRLSGIEAVGRLAEIVEVRRNAPGRLPGRAAVAAEVDGDQALVGQPCGQRLEATRVSRDPVQADHRVGPRLTPYLCVQNCHRVSGARPRAPRPRRRPPRSRPRRGPGRGSPGGGRARRSRCRSRARRRGRCGSSRRARAPRCSCSSHCTTRPCLTTIISSWSGCLWNAWAKPGASSTSITTYESQPVLVGAPRMPALPQSNVVGLDLVLQHEAARHVSSPSSTGMDLKRRMFSVIAVSVGSRSIDEAPKKPTMPVVRAIT